MSLVTTLYSCSSTTLKRLVVVGWGHRLNELLANCHELTGVLPVSTEWLIEDILTAFNTNRACVLGHKTYWYLELECASDPVRNLDIQEIVAMIEELLNEELQFLRRRFTFDNHITAVRMREWCRVTTGGIEPILEIEQKCVDVRSFHSGNTMIFKPRRWVG